MKANNLSISLPNVGCDKKCPYCVSKMTGFIPFDPGKYFDNLEKVKNVAQVAGVNSVSLSGKGEPLLFWKKNERQFRHIVEAFRDYPLEIQTNGRILSKSPYPIEALNNMGIDIFAISVDSPGDIENLKVIAEKVNEINSTVRVTVNLTSLLPKEALDFSYWINFCKENKVHQLSFRQITKVENPLDQTVADWIDLNTGNYYDKISAQLVDVVGNKQPIRELPFGAKLYDIDGVAVTKFDFCIQEHAGEENIRSLIYGEDGHLYTSWSSRASRIF